MESAMKLMLYVIVLGLSLALTCANTLAMIAQDQSTAAFNYAATGFFFGLVGILFSSLGLVCCLRPR